jgi:hypothetical protein
VNNLQAAINLYRDGKLQADDVIAMYDTVSEAISGASAKNDAEIEDNMKTKATIESALPTARSLPATTSSPSSPRASRPILTIPPS